MKPAFFQPQVNEGTAARHVNARDFRATDSDISDNAQ